MMYNWNRFSFISCYIYTLEKLENYVVVREFLNGVWVFNDNLGVQLVC